MVKGEPKTNLMPRNPLSPSIFALAALICPLLPLQADDSQTKTVEFERGRDNAVITDRISGDASVIYRLNARQGQFLSISLRPDNQSAEFNLYGPGDEPGDKAIYISATEGREYSGQLKENGDYSVSVFLNRNAARKGETANFDIVFRITDQPAGRMHAELPARAEAVAQARPAPAAALPWEKVTMKDSDHAPLLQRQAGLPPKLTESAPAIVLLVLEPDFLGIAEEAKARYNSMESPRSVTVTIIERGILDDDLLGLRHLVSLELNSNEEWRVVGYQRGELRRKHLE